MFSLNRMGGCLLLIGFSLSGCTTLRPQIPKLIDPATGAACYPISEFQADLMKYRAAISEGKIAGATLVRDRMIARIRLEIETNYRLFEMRLYENRAVFDTGADWVELALAASVTAVGGEAIKTALGAVLTAAKGAHLSVDKNWFREKNSEAILTAMQAERNKKLVIITRKMTQGDASQYSFDEAWADLVEFFYAGTLENGLMALSSRAGKEAEEAKNERKTVEEHRAEMFTLQKAAPEDIVMVEKLSEWLEQMRKKKDVKSARDILEALKQKPGAQDDPFGVLQDLIRKAEDHGSWLALYEAFRKVMGK
jgi:hypothetical protein